MQWSTERYAGFTDVQPWLPVNSDYMDKNVNVSELKNTVEIRI